MKLLVTGGSGFLGKRTVPYFEKLGWEVLAPSHAALDITDEAGVLAWFRQHRDITMAQSKLNAAGISFPTTAEGLCRAFR